ncbi:hypothetical protein ILUMI_02078, partial [Ignelater luminosus]
MYSLTLVLLIIYLVAIKPIKSIWFEYYGEVAQPFLTDRFISVEDYPYMVGIVYLVNTKKIEQRHMCSGSIINTNGVVVTAASCKHKLDSKRYSLTRTKVTGGSEYWDYCNCGVGKVYDIAYFAVHPNFIPADRHNESSIPRNDVAVIKLRTIPKWDARSFRVGWPEVAIQDSTLQVLGWGYITDDLKCTQNFHMLDFNRCQRFIGKKRIALPRNVFCLRLKGQSNSIDVGSPVIWKDPNGKEIILI